MKFDKSHVPRTILELSLGAVLGTVITFSVTFLFEWISRGTVILNGLFVSVLAVLIIMMATILTAHAVLCRFRLHAWYHYCALAGLAGGIIGAIFLSFGRELEALGLYGSCSALCALIAWLIRRPDKDKPVSPAAKAHV